MIQQASGIIPRSLRTIFEWNEVRYLSPEASLQLTSLAGIRAEERLDEKPVFEMASASRLMDDYGYAKKANCTMSR